MQQFKIENRGEFENFIKLMKKITLYKADIDRKSDLIYLLRFQYMAYYHNENPQKKKLCNQWIKCQFLEYKNRNQYRLMTLFDAK